MIKRFKEKIREYEMLEWDGDNLDNMAIFAHPDYIVKQLDEEIIIYQNKSETKTIYPKNTKFLKRTMDDFNYIQTASDAWLEDNFEEIKPEKPKRRPTWFV